MPTPFNWDFDIGSMWRVVHSADGDYIESVETPVRHQATRHNATVYPDQPNTAFTGPSSEYSRSQEQAVPQQDGANLIDGLFDEEPKDEDERQDREVPDGSQPNGLSNSLKSPGVTGQPLSSFGR